MGHTTDRRFTGREQIKMTPKEINDIQEDLDELDKAFNPKQK